MAAESSSRLVALSRETVGGSSSCQDRVCSTSLMLIKHKLRV